MKTLPAVITTTQDTVCVPVEEMEICPRNFIRDKSGKCRKMKPAEYFPVNQKPWKYYTKIELDMRGYSVEELLRNGASKEQLVKLQYDAGIIDDVLSQINRVTTGTMQDEIGKKLRQTMATEEPAPIGIPLKQSVPEDQEAAPDDSEEETTEETTLETETPYSETEESEPSESDMNSTENIVDIPETKEIESPDKNIFGSDSTGSDLQDDSQTESSTQRGMLGEPEPLPNSLLQQPGLFGQPEPPSAQESQQSGMFGQPDPPSAQESQQPGMFGQPEPAVPTDLVEESQQSEPPQTSMFGEESHSMFGQPEPQPAVQEQPGMFGLPEPPPAVQEPSESQNQSESAPTQLSPELKKKLDEIFDSSLDDLDSFEI